MTARAADAVDAHIGRRIRQRRADLEQTQAELADLCGVQYQQMQKYEAGTNRVSASRLYRIAAAQGVAVGWYFEGMQDA